MSDERARHELHVELERVHGADHAGTLMGYLPPVGWADVATKTDLTNLEGRLRAELHVEIASVRTDITRLSAGMSELRGDLFAEMARQTRTLLFSITGMMIALVAVMLAAS